MREIYPHFKSIKTSKLTRSLTHYPKKMTYKDLYEQATPLTGSEARIAKNITAIKIGDKVVETNQVLTSVMDFEKTLPPELMKFKPTWIEGFDEKKYKPLKAIYCVQMDTKEELVNEEGLDVIALAGDEQFNLGKSRLQNLTKSWMPMFDLDERNPYPPFFYQMLMMVD